MTQMSVPERRGLGQCNTNTISLKGMSQMMSIYRNRRTREVLLLFVTLDTCLNRGAEAMFIFDYFEYIVLVY